MNKEKLLKQILTNPVNVSFTDFVVLIEAFGFRQARTTGSHCIFKHINVPELMNIQNVNGQAKPYQIRQFLTLVEKYSLSMKVDKK